MARPRKGQELHAVTHLGVRVPLDLRKALDRIAAHNGRSITDEVRTALDAYVQTKIKDGTLTDPGKDEA